MPTPDQRAAESLRPEKILPRADYKLADNLDASRGVVFLTGIQALVRLPLMQARLDALRGLNTAGFISGYRGSPLGGYDQGLWKARSQLSEAKIEFLPAINEELGGTAVLGSQQVESDPERTVDGVFAIWYGKGPGVDRAGDALKHGNAYGSSPHGGVLVVAGDDHGCVSSSMPHQSDLTMQAWSMPVLHPGSVAEYLEFGLYGWALSRFSGNWVGFKAISEVVESGMTVDLDQVRVDFPPPDTFDGPADGLHYRWPDLPSLALEQRLARKLDAVRAFARSNSIDRWIAPSPGADLGIITCGKAHYDFLEVLRRLELDLDELEAAGIRVYKVGLVFPLEPSRIETFVDGLTEILVIEEKGAVIERQLKELLFNRAGPRPRVIGKTDANGRPLLSALGELRPSRIMPVFANWLAGHKPALDRRAHVCDFTAPEVLSNAGDAVRRLPYFCSGCPHNTSTKVPEGSIAQAGIGCHFMASWMDRATTGLIQMGGEGVDWSAHGRFTRRKHVFQNLGDGTYFHSGILAIRQAIAARANITYKILYNDAVAMTGGQPVDGVIGVERIARQVEAEGVERLAVVSDEPEKYKGQGGLFPPGTSFHHRSELDQVQRMMREIAGVTCLIYDQTCAAEKRRRRKKKAFPDPDRRIFINAAVCEGCGDCGDASNCLSVLPLETPLGRKRQIEQSSCNKDYACVQGFCPSFVSVAGATLKKRVGKLDRQRLDELITHLPLPSVHLDEAPYDMLITGVGGTGVVTVGALVSMAAHLDGMASSQLDFMGFAQKGGAVLAFIRWAKRPELLNQVRIDTQQADLLLACDLVVGASADALQTVRHGRTRIVSSEHQNPTDKFVRDPDANLHADALLEKMRFAAGSEAMESIDAYDLSLRLLGDSIGANILLLGYAWQRGLVPVSLPAIERAIELNGVAVEMNRMAFHLGRLTAERPDDVLELADEPTAKTMSLDALVAHREAHLTAYQDAAYAARYRKLVDMTRDAERRLVGDGAALALTEAVAFGYAKLLAYKDEYEVARLFTDGRFAEQLRETFDGALRLSFHMAPPLLARADASGRTRKITLGPWLMSAMKLLAKAKGLRGSRFDLFGRTAERRMERELAEAYPRLITALLGKLDRESLADAIALADLPRSLRGYGHVKHAALHKVAARESRLVGRFAIEPVFAKALERLPPLAQNQAFKGISVVTGK
ncbi:indolepyruvate ferredoxin oxidoreductase family protein [Cognatazoarcus halotolerans]|uniref:indolepyruvate ferredoxin oxidoreductase family protein n=1 Tax=Cognatazoarcus halotolerans TaxID=2686016 RepID=UPI00135C348A|nr:indolepyruvate ferredoxin oxidoreductase family protein [Cognatazoarcus halotolerans]MCB1901612.1 indolepyruvate ferredoxin oxidoreductase family protein [Rhodocyclaceae bacterium]MCP5308455.1 indolepyruvate ferredoxin oxidoreductase family protein [Zoogloeaceae bacterium]